MTDCVSVETFAGRESCLREALLAATKELGPLAAAEELDSLLTAHPQMRETCHQPAHVVGEVSNLPNREMMTDYLTARQLHTCDWGVLHGILFRYAQEHDVNNIAGLLDVCTQLRDGADRAGCADSIGHVLWEKAASFPAAANACAEVPELLDSCVSGVFMQLYSPVAPSGLGQAIGASMTLTEVVKLCDIDTATLATACARAAHYAYSQILGPIRYRMSKSPDPATEFRESFRPAFTDGVRFCAKFGQAGAVACTQELSRYSLQLLLTFQDAGMLNDVCAAIPEEVASYCNDARKSLGREPVTG
jgi:hypothetical protein